MGNCELPGLENQENLSETIAQSDKFRDQSLPLWNEFFFLRFIFLLPMIGLFCIFYFKKIYFSSVSSIFWYRKEFAA